MNLATTRFTSTGHAVAPDVVSQSHTIPFPALRCEVLFHTVSPDSFVGRVQCMLSTFSGTTEDSERSQAIEVLATLDSGAEASMIRQSTATELGLQPTGELEIFHFAGPARTMAYLAQVGCCGSWRTVQLVDDGGAYHPADLAFPELLIGRDLMQYMSLSVDGPKGEWTLDVHYDLWPEEVSLL